MFLMDHDILTAREQLIHMVLPISKKKSKPVMYFQKRNNQKTQPCLRKTQSRTWKRDLIITKDKCGIISQNRPVE